MIFATAYNRNKVIPSPLGSSEAPIFDAQVVDGELCLVQVGVDDVKGRIEASKNDCLISTIIDRFNRGDVSVLQKTQGFYGDFTNFPCNFQDGQNLLVKLRNDFDNLPPDLKLKFDGSFDNYVKEVANYTLEDFANTFVPSSVDSSPDSSDESGESEVK